MAKQKHLHEERCEMKLTQLAGEYRDYQRKAKLIAPSTIRNYCVRVRGFCAWLGADSVVASLTVQQMRRFHVEVTQRHPRAVKMYRAALRHFCLWLIAEGWLNADPTEGIPLPKVAPQRRIPITDTIICDMFTACDRLPEGAYRRSLARAVLAVMAYAGLRRSEIFNLKMNDVDFKERCIEVNNGKGGKNRNVYPCAECFDDLRGWLRERPRDTEHDYLFCYNRLHRLGAYTLMNLIKEVKCVAGYEGVQMTPHQFRHAFASRLSNHQVPLPHIQAQLGHSQLTTTATYLHTTDENVRSTAHLGSLQPDTSPAPGDRQKPADSRPEQRSRRIPRRP